VKNIFLFLLIFPSLLFGQITLSETDFASQGDTVRMSLTDQTTTDYISAGEAFTWDFSDLVATSQFVREFTSIGFSPVQLTFGIFADEEYQSSYFIPETNFPLEQIGDFLPISLSDPRSYQKSTEDSITKVGFSIKVSGIDVAFPSDTIETKYKFPMTYNQVFTTKGYTFIDFSPAADFKIKQLRNITSTVDGYGQLILPFGTFDVLRLKREINEIDSIYQLFFGPPSWFGAPPFQSTEYEWIGQNKKEVLLRIIVSNINGSEQIRVIEYQDSYLGLDAGLNNIDFHVSAFPNPTSEQIKISTALPIRNYTVCNTFGTKLEKQQDLNTDDFTIDFTSFSSGVYFLILESISGTKTIRVTKN